MRKVSFGPSILAKTITLAWKTSGLQKLKRSATFPGNLRPWRKTWLHISLRSTEHMRTRHNVSSKSLRRRKEFGLQSSKGNTTSSAILATKRRLNNTPRHLSLKIRCRLSWSLTLTTSMTLYWCFVTQRTKRKAWWPEAEATIIPGCRLEEMEPL